MATVTNTAIRALYHFSRGTEETATVPRDFAWAFNHGDQTITREQAARFVRECFTDAINRRAGIEVPYGEEPNALRYDLQMVRHALRDDPDAVNQAWSRPSTRTGRRLAARHGLTFVRYSSRLQRLCIPGGEVDLCLQHAARFAA